jgi:adenine phosphoribosyltransferase
MCGGFLVGQTNLQIDVEALRAKVRDVPDFPQSGILFRDITPLLADPASFRAVVDAMAVPFAGVSVVVAIESRGFILGAPVAYNLGAGLVPVRKAGRLPSATLREEYALEYGTNTVEVHSDAVRPGERVLIVDDLLATGGTVRAAVNLVERLGAEVAGITVLAELAFLNGRQLLQDYDVRSLIVY